MSTIANKIKELPSAPGVYFFYGGDKELLYIGKATNLKSRVQSYFRNVIPDFLPAGRHGIRNPEMLKQVQHDIIKIANVVGRSEWIGRMVSQVVDIAFEQTDSVLEALILESNLIKKHQPKYNTLEKDDKSFSYFVITKEEFPRILIVRKTDLDKPIRNNETNSNLRTKKLEASSYKPAAVFGPYTSKHQMQVALKIMRRIFPFHALKQQSEKGCLDFQLGICPGPYAGAISKVDYKKNIRGIKMILEGKKKSLLRVLEKEMQAGAKKQEFEKAASLRNKIYALEHIRDVALMTRDFEETNMEQRSTTLSSGHLSCPGENNMEGVFRIEAYDISNISGDHAVGSMVVFENLPTGQAGGKPNKSEYRKFKIKTIKGANDVGMMREVLLRRFKNDWPMPDLVLLDGGLGHLNMAEKLLYEELGLAVAIAGVAKGPSRKNLKLQMTNSKQITNDKLKNSIKDVLDDKNLLKHIMDEAHRFAITYHRKVRGKNSLL
ncbi:MAG: Excinuclease ABC subunit C [uncultured bacterium]|nr:MAG: Excinuclease ABC subunit C [uncultured bacterium]